MGCIYSLERTGLLLVELLADYAHFVVQLHSVNCTMSCELTNFLEVVDGKLVEVVVVVVEEPVDYSCFGFQVYSMNRKMSCEYCLVSSDLME